MTVIWTEEKVNTLADVYMNIVSCVGSRFKVLPDLQTTIESPQCRFELL